jgi:hypothetical protein
MHIVKKLWATDYVKGIHVRNELNELLSICLSYKYNSHMLLTISKKLTQPQVFDTRR